MKYAALFLVGLAYAQPPNPIKANITETPNGGVKVVIENDSNAVLTAVAFSGPTEAHTYFLDSALQQWHEVEPGKQSQMGFGNLHQPSALELKAAILADGKTFGDVAIIDTMLSKRRAWLQGLGIILQHLPDANTVTSPTPLVPLFRTYKDQQLKGLAFNDPVQIAIVNENGIMQRKMEALTGESPASIIAAMKSMLIDWQSALVRSLPSLSAAR